MARPAGEPDHVGGGAHLSVQLPPASVDITPALSYGRIPSPQRHGKVVSCRVPLGPAPVYGHPSCPANKGSALVAGLGPRRPVPLLGTLPRKPGAGQ